MRNAKEIVKRTMKVGSRNPGMWMLSLLINRGNIRDLESAIKLIIVVACSKYLTNRVRLCIGTLNKVLKDFRADIFEETKKAIENECSELTTDSHKKKKGPDTEEDYYIKCEQSPFKIHFEKIYKNQLESIKKDDSEGGSSNDLYAPNFFPTILANLLPTVPLWSGLLLGNLSRHGESKDYENYAQNLIKHPRINHTFNENFVTSNRTTGISEKRMGDLYNSLLGGKQAARLDDIVALLHENILGMQKMFSDSVTTKIIKSDKTTNVLHEQWDKKRGKTCKTLTYQDGAKKDLLINIEIKEKMTTRKRYSINKIHKTQTKR